MQIHGSTENVSIKSSSLLLKHTTNSDIFVNTPHFGFDFARFYSENTFFVKIVCENCKKIVCFYTCFDGLMYKITIHFKFCYMHMQ